jgi:hypothetical protein
MSGFETIWRRWHKGYAPLGHRLRDAGAPNWVRFHSLPGSKRYADDAQEDAVVRARWNTLAGEVLGEGLPCWLVSARWPQPDLEDYKTEDAFGARYGLEPAMTFASEDQEAEGSASEPWTALAAPLTWRSGAYDELFDAIAAGSTWGWLWLSHRTGAVFAPYDGGVDLFPTAADEADRLRRQYAEWLPDHPSRL